MVSADDNACCSAFWRRSLLLALALVAGLGGGCAALTNPVSQGIPARRVPPELLAAPKTGLESIPLNLLGQEKPPVYQLGCGDILAVYIEGILGNENFPPPTNVGPQVQDPIFRRWPATTGFPVPVEADGTINLPRLGSLRVAGMTVSEARAKFIRELGISKNLIVGLNDPKGATRLMVSLLQPRLCTVLVVRQEASTFNQGNFGIVSGSKRGNSYTLELPAYENDVLHALARSGGLPGLDACNEILVHRNALGQSSHGPYAERIGDVLRIPLRVPPGTHVPIKPRDVILGQGDVVYVEARDEEVYFTGGLIPPGQFVLPRDRDLDVIEVISYARGPLLNGSFAVSNLSGALIQQGIGNPNPTRVTVIRRTPNGGQIPIIVDLAKVFRDPSERINIKGGDLIILQETPGQALTRYFTQTFFNFNLVWQAIHDRFITGVVNVATPDRVSSQVPTINIPQQ